MGLTLAKKEALLTLVRGLQSLGTKLVLDASALIPSILTQIDNTETIVTPHSAEFKRIFGEVVGDSRDERISNVHKTAKLHGITILLKGWIDIVSSSERVAVNTTHNSGMTVGGTGDVLSGLVSGLLSKYSPFEGSSAWCVYQRECRKFGFKEIRITFSRYRFNFKYTRCNETF